MRSPTFGSIRTSPRAISEGREISAWDHYNKHGRKEGRKVNDFDADHSLRSYPLAAVEIAAGRATSVFEHFMREQVERHVRSLVERAEQSGIAKKPFAAKKRDVLVRQAVEPPWPPLHDEPLRRCTGRLAG